MCSSEKFGPQDGLTNEGISLTGRRRTLPTDSREGGMERYAKGTECGTSSKKLAANAIGAVKQTIERRNTAALPMTAWNDFFDDRHRLRLTQIAVGKPDFLMTRMMKLATRHRRTNMDLGTTR